MGIWMVFWLAVKNSAITFWDYEKNQSIFHGAMKHLVTKYYFLKLCKLAANAEKLFLIVPLGLHTFQSQFVMITPNVFWKLNDFYGVMKKFQVIAAVSGQQEFNENLLGRNVLLDFRKIIHLHIARTQGPLSKHHPDTDIWLLIYINYLILIWLRLVEYGVHCVLFLIFRTWQRCLDALYAWKEWEMQGYAPTVQSFVVSFVSG